MATTKWVCLAPLVAAILILTACDLKAKDRNTSNMTALTSRLQPVFEKTKTVCFGRFLVDVPETATVEWGGADVPLGVEVYPGAAEQVNDMAQKFVDELKLKTSEYHTDPPMFVSTEDVLSPKGKIVIGYADLSAVNLKINGYFRLNDDAVVIDALPIEEYKESALAEVRSIAQRLRQRTESEIPGERGNCIKHAFLPDIPGLAEEPPADLISIGFRLKEFPDTVLTIFLGPSNPYHSEGDSLEWRLKQFDKEQATQDPSHSRGKTKYLRKGARKIHDWLNGFEALSQTQEQRALHGTHFFAMDFMGVPADGLKPYAKIIMETGDADNAAGAIPASLNDKEAIAVWDKITSTIRARPTAKPEKTSPADAAPRRTLPARP